MSEKNIASIFRVSVKLTFEKARNKYYLLEWDNA
jgi:hypothetical protein